MEDISKKILKLRKERGWSQKELAKQLNVSDKLISKWETSQSTPSIDYIKEMCKIFNVDMSEFVDVPKKKKKLSSKAKKGIIISTVMFFAACIIAGFVVLSVYIFVPALFKEKYLFNLSMSFGRNFSGTSFNFTISGRGAEQNFIGRFDDGKVEWQYKSRKFGESSYDIEILKDNILYKKEYSQVTKTIYKPTCKNLLGLYEEMMAYYGNDTSDVNVDEIPITYIRKSNDTYIFETSKDYFNKKLENDISVTDTPTGTFVVKNDRLLRFNLNAKIKYYDKKESNYKNEDISITLSFNFDEVGEITLPSEMENAVYDTNSFGEAQSFEEYSNNPDAFFNLKKAVISSIFVERSYDYKNGDVSFKKDGVSYQVSLPKSDCKVAGMDADYNIFYYDKNSKYVDDKFRQVFYCYNPFTKQNVCSFYIDDLLSKSYYLTNGNVIFVDLDEKVYFFDGKTHELLDKKVTGYVIENPSISGLWIDSSDYALGGYIYNFDINFNLIGRYVYNYDNFHIIRDGIQIPNTNIIYYSGNAYSTKLNLLFSGHDLFDHSAITVDYMGYKIDIVRGKFDNELIFVRYKGGNIEYENVSIKFNNLPFAIVINDKLYVCVDNYSDSYFFEVTLKSAPEAA